MADCINTYTAVLLLIELQTHHRHQVCLDMCTVSKVSYRYHKTDTGIISKWQISDTFNDTFSDDINKDRASLTQKWMISLN